MEKKDNSDDSIPNGKLPMIKIKIPKKAEDTSAAGEGEEVRSHYCKECNKSFSSGKALGGHMSSAHVQANKDYSSSSSSSKKLSSKRKSPLSLNNACDLCGKKFHSKKSLFGHMRCHPERYWRGMVPRQSIAAAAASSSSEDDRVDSGRHELGFSLMSWPTSKRGRAAAESSEKKEKEQPIVAGLQLLNFLSDESRKEGGDGRRIPAVGGKGKEKVGSGRDFEIDPNDELVITAIQVLAGGKRESEKRAAEEDPKLAPSSSSPEKFKCSVCGKFFPTHQALGGHRSSHNKFKMTVVNTSTRPANPQTPPPSRRKETLVKTNAETATSVAVAHAFDLNVALTAEEEDMEIGDSSNTTPSGY